MAISVPSFTHFEIGGRALTHSPDLTFAEEVAMLEFNLLPLDAASHALLQYCSDVGSAPQLYVELLAPGKVIFQLEGFDQLEPTLVAVPDDMDQDLKSALWGDLAVERARGKPAFMRLATPLASDHMPLGICYVATWAPNFALDNLTSPTAQVSFELVQPLVSH
jgi:hypothetical protein